MKLRLLPLAAAAMIVSISCARIPHTGKIALKNEVDSVSNALGFMMAKQMVTNFQGPFDTINVAALAPVFAKSKMKKEMLDRYKTSFDTISEEAFYAGLFNQLAEPKNNNFKEADADTYLRGIYTKKMQQKQDLKAQAGVKNLEIGRAFLAENGKKAGVITTASGLQYEVLKAGNGPKPKAEDKVKVHYHGTTINGTVFDSSVQRGEPVEFGVGQVIKGWTEALQLMSVGSKFKLTIPSELAYGAQGGGDKIAANEVLVFEVELLEITK